MFTVGYKVHQKIKRKKLYHDIDKPLRPGVNCTSVGSNDALQGKLWTDPRVMHISTLICFFLC